MVLRLTGFPFRSAPRGHGCGRGALGAAAAVAALGLALTACGSGHAGGTPAGGGAGAKGGAGHALHTVMGEVTVGPHPRRVVVLDTDALDSAVTLGVRPVGATTVAAGAPVSTYLPKNSTAGIKPVGVIGSPDLEAVAALKPDLILGSKARDAKSYQQLSAIAPTVFTDTTGPAWRQNFTLHARALDRTGRAAEVEKAYTTQVKHVVAALGGAAKAKSTTVAFVRFVEGANTRLYLNDTFVGSLFHDLGLGRPADQDRDGFSLDVGPEQIDKADADVIFRSTYGDPAKARETDIVGGPLWHKLTAVRHGRAYAVDDNLWMLGIGYTGAGQILRQIQADYTGGAGS
ncbi:iron-siderophore ABC transporter substrate-binding protein [Streptomyces sp. 8L]|uniref:iron-siderophore ABC transporter substrate-binding protein n=1 Tax=Streptomyces sp. 8L TaxID=2877242 RepID=UPI001CD5887D|nr:iron-siderophore ABC transporter substrate-binding protein [Streptomyces sp. 8L]MCA1223225.1 iron-siderophore ABC transporter substrate-binding protein [Streptomyces sp. 8L]